MLSNSNSLAFLDLMHDACPYKLHLPTTNEMTIHPRVKIKSSSAARTCASANGTVGNPTASTVREAHFSSQLPKPSWPGRAGRIRGPKRAFRHRLSICKHTILNLFKGKSKPLRGRPSCEDLTSSLRRKTVHERSFLSWASHYHMASRMWPIKFIAGKAHASNYINWRHHVQSFIQRTEQ